MGGRHSVARLLFSLAGIVVAWGSTAFPAVAADAWRLRVSSKLLSVYDAPAGNRLAVASARFNAKGWVQADVHYDCAGESPAQALGSAGLAISSAARLASFCVIEGWVAPGSLAQIATITGVKRVSLPSYAVVPHLKVPTSAPA